ncbi:uncharacterized protein B0I36DRAFT_364402 [Microdochium trichocladiopsis]|uniref:MARVEL domain-containing protein n=1 Tax=Microdochium trichocladiopsis TaxID=1682393 RepID=A0A9P9BQ75_9PEZI|nr:uncharacterized protein B0I36DRAFT_364402 [Microdochium trichocladiopsis]KAH7029935.1 hypothetical protein B0I36DRAFT_364402 [Microdochium trichocladiopsis]
MPIPQAEAPRPIPRPAGQEHVLIYPRGFLAVRVIQLVAAIVVLGTAGYVIGALAASPALAGFGLSLFSGIATIICVVYYIVAEYALPAAYNYWAYLALDIFLVVFWLISFALVAVPVAYFGTAAYSLSSYGLTLYYSGCIAAGFGAISFAALHRHRAAGGHCTAAQTMPVVAPSASVAPPGYQAGSVYPAPPNQAAAAAAAGPFQGKQQGQFATTIPMQQQQMPVPQYQQMPANMYMQQQQQQMPGAMPMQWQQQPQQSPPPQEVYSRAVSTPVPQGSPAPYITHAAPYYQQGPLPQDAVQKQ